MAGIGFFLFIGLLSCGDEYFFDDVDCSECFIPRPEVGPVNITITIDSENKEVPVRIYKGKYEESYRNDLSNVIFMDTISNQNFSVDLEVNEYYSAVAEYKKNGEKILVVDGDRLKQYKVSDNCDEVCWIYKGGNIDATLKK
ncbi:MAG: hypothetical protein HC830_09590 [Bacteroidetes bacterium]|nr:hypothetical protein [Bacteroidota bacterium]